MREARDSFLHFLADNLTGIEIHPRRFDPNDPSLTFLKEDAINVEFLGLSLGDVASQQVVLDIIHTDELTAVDWMQTVWSLFKAAFYTPLLDYSSGSPVSTGKLLYWGRSVSFRRVYEDNYCRYSCTMNLRFQAV